MVIGHQPTELILGEELQEQVHALVRLDEPTRWLLDRFLPKPGGAMAWGADNWHHARQSPAMNLRVFGRSGQVEGDSYLFQAKNYQKQWPTLKQTILSHDWPPSLMVSSADHGAGVGHVADRPGVPWASKGRAGTRPPRGAVAPCRSCPLVSCRATACRSKTARGEGGRTTAKNGSKN